AHRFFIYDGRLYRRSLPRMPPRLVPRLEDVAAIKRTFHGDHPGSFGHLGVLTAYQMIALRYFWFNLYSDIEEWVRACPVCQLRQLRRPKQYQLFRIIPPALLFTLLGLDCVTYPNAQIGRSSQVYIGCLCVFDYPSGYGWAYPLKAFDGLNIVLALRDWCARYGVPVHIVVDN
ncbi:uncharacterized protein EV422DRAFT_480240, partial [Fimicolochytrium jonesii]|uniref:uncharacterized protein n=1 Tax=Fimicolochytrium jonesii TaxID=1396493 RepID=UPI0022FE0546